MKKPLLAATAPDDLSGIKYPLMVSAKLDGLRCIVDGGKPMSRSGKVIRNQFVQKWFAEHPETEGLDGELGVGDPNAKDFFRVSTSAIMSGDGEPDFNFYVFDHIKAPNAPYSARYEAIKKQSYTSRVVVLEQVLIGNEKDLLDYEQQVLGLGYEGLILRSPTAPYKFGRSTLKEGTLLKLKRFADDEAEILDFVELMHNDNEATKDAFGRTERSSHKENLVPAGVLGALQVRDLKTGVEFEIGTGFDQAERVLLWNTRSIYKGSIVKYKHFIVGAKDKPRFPSFQGFRDRDDL